MVAHPLVLVLRLRPRPGILLSGLGQMGLTPPIPSFLGMPLVGLPRSLLVQPPEQVTEPPGVLLLGVFLPPSRRVGSDQPGAGFLSAQGLESRPRQPLPPQQWLVLSVELSRLSQMRWAKCLRVMRLVSKQTIPAREWVYLPPDVVRESVSPQMKGAL